MIRLLYVGGINPGRFIYEAVKGVSMVDGFELLFKGKDDGKKSSCSVMLCMYDPKIKNNRFNMPNKLYLALKYKMPIIVSKNSEAAKLVNKYGCGFTCEYNLDSFVELLNNIHINSINEMCKLAGQAYRDHNWEMDKKVLLNLYK